VRPGQKETDKDHLQGMNPRADKLAGYLNRAEQAYTGK